MTFANRVLNLCLCHKRAVQCQSAMSDIRTSLSAAWYHALNLTTRFVLTLSVFGLALGGLKRKVVLAERNE